MRKEKKSKQATLKSVLSNVRAQTDKEQESNHGVETAFIFIWKTSASV